MVGLGGKEGWGFCKVSTPCPVNPPTFLSPPPSLLPSFAPKPPPPPPRLAVSLGPTLLPIVCVCLVSPFPPFGFPESVGEGGRVGEWPSEGVGGGVGQRVAPSAGLRPPGRGAFPGSRGRGWAGAWGGLSRCVPPGEVHCGGSCWRSRVGGGGREGKRRSILKTNIQMPEQQPGHPLGAAAGRRGGVALPLLGSLVCPRAPCSPSFFLSLLTNVSKSWKTPQPRKCVGKENKNFPNPKVPCRLFGVGLLGPWPWLRAGGP